MLEDHFLSFKDSWADQKFKSKMVYIGDNIHTDVKFAKNAGI
jgi:ribonucleotide monophosphatase NagD (HAD superfamily)